MNTSIEASMASVLKKRVDKSYLTLPYCYTEAEVLTASASKPLHKRKREPLVLAVREAVEAAIAGAAMVEHWRTLADAANIAETLITSAAFADPDGLFADAVNAVTDMGRQYGAGQAMRLEPEQQEHLGDFCDAYQLMLEQASERTYLQACRTTERRLRELLMHACGQQDHEFLVI